MRTEIIQCDVTGEYDAQPTTFAVDGTTYEIDLSEVGRKQLDEALLPFVSVARMVAQAPTTAVKMATEPGDPGPVAAPPASRTARPANGRRTNKAAPPASATLTKTERSACRAWAIRFPGKAGTTVNKSGQLPASVVDRWIVAGKPGLS